MTSVNDAVGVIQNDDDNQNNSREKDKKDIEMEMEIDEDDDDDDDDIGVLEMKRFRTIFCGCLLMRVFSGYCGW